MRLRWIGLSVSVAVVVGPAAAFGFPGRVTKDAEHIAEDTAHGNRFGAADAAGSFGGYSTAAEAITTAALATPQGLVGAWAFSEGSGSTTADASGSGNVGTITNATCRPRAGSATP